MGSLRFNISGVLLAIASHSISSASILEKRDANGPWFTDFPDPGLIQAEGYFYAFATNSGPYHIPTAFSTDIGSGWQYVANDTDLTKQWDSLPALPSWIPAENQQVWAPDMAQMVSAWIASILHCGRVSHPGSWLRLSLDDNIC